MNTGTTNRTRVLAALTTLALAGGTGVALSTSASAAPGGDLVYGLTATDALVSFRAQAPGTVSTPIPITGVNGADVVGIDVRPATGQLYALTKSATNAGTLYVVNPATGAATQVAAVSTALSGTRFGVDFNPTVDRLRIVSDSEQNLRVNPDTGAATTDTAVSYAAGDPGAGTTPDVAGAGYTSNVQGAASTTLYDIDIARGTLVRQDPPNAGTLNTIGSLGQLGITDAGLDISATTGTAYAALSAGTATALYTVSLTTGAAQQVGTFGGQAVQDITVASPRFTAAVSDVTEGGAATVTVTRSGDAADAADVTYTVTGGTATAGTDFSTSTGTLSFGANETSRVFTVQTTQDDFTEGRETATVTLSGATVGNAGRATTFGIVDDEAGLAYGLTSNDTITKFSVNDVSTVTSTSLVVGVTPGDDLVGIDVRPQTGVLYAVARNTTAGTSTLYRLSAPAANDAPITATAVAAISIPLQGTSFGVDFNPMVDRLRIVSDTRQNLRVNPDTGAATNDTALNYATTDANATTVPAVTGAGYTGSSSATPTATTLYDLDTAKDVLVRQAPPNDGVLTTVGPLGIGDVALNTGLDIAASGNAAFALLSTTAQAATTTSAAVAATALQLYRVNLDTGAATALTGANGAAQNAPTSLEDFALISTTPTTAVAPTPSASATPSASPTVSTSPSATPTAGSPTPTPTNTPGTPVGPISATVAPTVITPGVQSVVTVTGTPGTVVELVAYSRPNTDFAVVRPGTALDENGRVVFRITPGTNTRLFARVVGTTVTTQQFVVNVRTALSLTVVRNGVRKYTFQGRILPRRAGQLITLYRVASGREIIATQIKTDSTGTYRIPRTFTGSGTFGFLTRTGQTLTNAAGVSNNGKARPTAIF
ncbi:MAG: hypothetical protein JWN17_2835 [Frankiales bacterium]|nr:hypothetical protein [Frankiales bacterium]